MSVYARREWTPQERPILPGSPSSPEHGRARRVAYFAVGVLVALTGGLGNALVSVNLVNLQGALGADISELQWLPAAEQNDTRLVTAAATLEVARERNRQGYVGTLEVLDAQRILYAVQVSQLQLTARQLLASVDLIRAMGGGWESPAQHLDRFIPSHPNDKGAQR